MNEKNNSIPQGKKLAWVLRNIREDKEMSQNDLSKLCGLSQQVISKLEINPERVSMPVFIRYCDGLNIDLADLLEQKFLN